MATRAAGLVEETGAFRRGLRGGAARAAAARAEHDEDDGERHREERETDRAPHAQATRVAAHDPGYRLLAVASSARLVRWADDDERRRNERRAAGDGTLPLRRGQLRGARPAARRAPLPLRGMQALGRYMGAFTSARLEHSRSTARTRSAGSRAWAATATPAAASAASAARASSGSRQTASGSTSPPARRPPRRSRDRRALVHASGRRRRAPLDGLPRDAELSSYEIPWR